MDVKKIVAIFAVIIIAVAAISIAYISTADKNDEPVQTKIGELMVYGNCNLDDRIDDEDITYLQKYLSGDIEATKYMDVNQDGEINSDDVEYLNKILKKENGTIVYYIDGYKNISHVEWPLNKIVVLSNSPQLMALAVGLDDSKIIGYTKEDKVLFSSWQNASVLTTSSLADFEKITSGKPDAVIVGNSEEPPSASILSLYERAGIDIITVIGMDGIESVNSALTLGFLVDCEEQSRAYAEWCDSMLSDISSEVASISESDKVSAIVWFGGFAAAGYDHDYTKSLEVAGGVPAADWSGWRQLNEDNNTWIYNYNPDYILRIFTMGYSSTEDSRNSLYEKYGSMIDQMECYKNGNFCVIDFNLPQVLRIAYMAEFMYPDVFGTGYADSWHQQLIDIYGIEYTVDGQFIVTSESYSG